MISFLVKFLPPQFRGLSGDEQRQWTIVLSVNCFTIALQLFYLHRHIVQHNFTQASYIIIPCLFLNLTAFIFSFKKNYFWASRLVVAPATIDLIYLILIAGGITAPATFWLALLPFFYGMFFGKKGSIFGAVITFLTFIFYLVLDYFGFVYILTLSENERYFEVVTNLFNYSLITALYYISYTSAFERSNKQLASSKELIDNLFRVVLHDITNPISVVKLRSKMLKKKLSKEQAEEIVKVETSINKVISILDSLRNFKAIDDGVIEIPLSENFISSIISDFYLEAEELASGKNIKLKCSLAIDKESKVLCHVSSLTNQVLMNIFSNALKFSAEESTVEIDSFEDDKKIYIEIKDAGIGIPDEIIANLFRFDKPTSRMGTDGEQGTGYGLPITKYFLELMNGQIEVESTEKCEQSTNHGTKFSLSFNKI
jgi:signal transduction histidine kinase